MTKTPTIFETCRPRADVLEGSVAEADFAADLAQVIVGKGNDEYLDPARFFANTYPTRGLRNLLANVCRRLAGAGGEVAAIFRILGARGDSMEPAVHDGDRLLVDMARKTPATGEMAVLWDGTGFVVKRVQVIPHAEPPKLRLISANPAYQLYDCLAGEAHIAGTVLWALSRV